MDEEGLAHATVRDLGALAQRHQAGEVDAVVVDLSASEPQSAVRVGGRCRELGVPWLCALPSQRLAAYSPAWGADDFFLLPPATGEITLRLERHLRAGDPASQGQPILTAGDLVIDPERYEVSLRSRRVLLTFKEYQLLWLLASNPGRVYSRGSLLEQVWGYDYLGGTRTVDVHIRRLRSKIEDPGHSYIETVWNVGYRFRPQDAAREGRWKAEAGQL
ncbi:MAG: response regulator transcription factor [Chloroflexi bacterium]|nr:response regulator transcription factor [Chloroflexota bacterium]